jgi:hypothetical protein
MTTRSALSCLVLAGTSLAASELKFTSAGKAVIVSYDGTDLTVPGYAKSAWVSSEIALLATTVGALDTRVGNIETILANNSLSITANEAEIIKNAGLISGQATADSTLQTNIDNIALTPGQKGQTGSEGAKGTHTVGEKGDAGVDGSKGDAGSNGSKGQTGEPAPTPAPTVFDGWTKTASVRCGTGAWFTDSAGQNVEECKALCSADENCYAIDIHQDWANGYCNLFTQAECTSFSTNGAYDAYINPAYTAAPNVKFISAHWESNTNGHSPRSSVAQFTNGDGTWVTGTPVSTSGAFQSGLTENCADSGYILGYGGSPNNGYWEIPTAMKVTQMRIWCVYAGLRGATWGLYSSSALGSVDRASNKIATFTYTTSTCGWNTFDFGY